MQVKHLLHLAAAQAACAQSLTEVLSSQNSTLSTLIGLLQAQPDLVTALSGLKGITILAPSNDAFTTLLSDPTVASMVESDPTIVPALLSYHVINGTFYASDLTAGPGPVFVPTLLADKNYSTVEGGQRVEVRSDGMGVSIFTGGGAESKVTKADLNFTSGTIHIIDKVLTIPANLTSVLMSSPDLSSLTGAVTKANLAQTLSDVPQLTIFAPNNAAFEAISDVAAGLTVEQLTAVLGYHAIAGAVVYSTDITTTTMNVKTVEGSEVMVRVEDGNVMVNDAKVIMPNILIKNGVVHVIDGVLIPEDLSGSPTPSAGPSTTTSGTPMSPTSSVVTGAAAAKGQFAGVAVVLGGLSIILNL